MTHSPAKLSLPKELACLREDLEEKDTQTLFDVLASGLAESLGGRERVKCKHELFLLMPGVDRSKSPYEICVV